MSLLPVFVSGCASMPAAVTSIANAVVDAMTIRSQVPADNELVALEKLKLEPGYVYLPFRADLVRQRENSGADKTKPGLAVLDTEEHDPVGYAVPGLRLGNGLFVDASRNLCLDFGELTGFSKMENCTLTVSDGSLIGGKTIIRKRGSDVTITEGTVITSSTGVTLGEKKTTIDRGFFSFDDTVRFDEKAVEFRPGGLFGWFNKTRIERKGDSFRIPGFIWDDQLACIEDGGSVRVLSGLSAGGFSLAADGKGIRITEPGCTYRFVRTASKIVFYDESRINGFAIDISGNRYSYVKKGLGKNISLTMTIEKN